MTLRARKERIVNCLLGLSRNDLEFLMGSTDRGVETISTAWRKKLEEEN